MFCFVNDLISELNHDVEIDKHNDKIMRKSKSKAYFKGLLLTLVVFCFDIHRWVIVHTLLIDR